MELDVALQAFAATVEVDGASGDGQLAKQLGDLNGQEGWRLGLVRLVAGDLGQRLSEYLCWQRHHITSADARPMG